MHFIQNANSFQRVSFTDIFDGLREYSINYFLPEIKDELTGYFSPNQVEECIRLIGGLREREFSLEDLEAHSKAARLSADINVLETLRVLFDCSAIGNIVKQTNAQGVQNIVYTFRHRNRNSMINYKQDFVLHRGAWKALNLM
ncbi:hypothetical protein AAFM46_09605 [Arthrobacter sp. TMP15]|uniref:hypothetical protein n=1 Tax=Arthrobacter sp. TMP15 TaxID=3140789 RepID=UPI0031BACBED